VETAEVQASARVDEHAHWAVSRWSEFFNLVRLFATIIRRTKVIARFAWKRPALICLRRHAERYGFSFLKK